MLRRGIETHGGAIGLLNALALGYRTQLPAEVRDDFAATGTIHIIAISGLHVVMIATIVILVLSAVGVSRIHWVIFLAPLLAGYTVATGMCASAVRAWVMAVVFFAAPLLRRKPDSLSALGLAAIVILAVAPSQIFDLGFILSFAAMLGLIVLYPPIHALVDRRLRDDPFRLQPEPRPTRLARQACRYIWSLLAASIAAWLATTPVIAHAFGRISAIGLLGNLIAVPMSFLILFTAMLSVLFGSLAVLFAEVFNHAALVLIAILVRSMHLMAGVPGSHFEVAIPTGWPMVFWYLGLGALALKLTVDKPDADSYTCSPETDSRRSQAEKNDGDVHEEQRPV